MESNNISKDFLAVDSTESNTRIVCSKNSRSRKCTVIWLDELTSFLQHQLLKGSNCSNAHMHLAYYCTCIYIVIREKGRGCYGAVYEVWLHGVPCIAKRLHDILVGRGQEEPVSEEDRRAAISWFCEERVLPAVPGRPFDHAERHAETRETKKSSRDQGDQPAETRETTKTRRQRETLHRRSERSAETNRDHACRETIGDQQNQRDQRDQTAKFNVLGSNNISKDFLAVDSTESNTRTVAQQEQSFEGKCTVIWLNELTSFLQHQLLKDSNCSNAHMHLEYYCTCIYRANLIVSIFL